MLFQLRTDNHIENSEGLERHVRSQVEAVFAPRLGDRLRRIEVYLQDVNSHKGGVDKRCAIELHLAGLQPVAASAEAADLDEALGAATEKLERALEHTLGRIEDRAGRVSMSGEPT